MLLGMFAKKIISIMFAIKKNSNKNVCYKKKMSNRSDCQL